MLVLVAVVAGGSWTVGALLDRHAGPGGSPVRCAATSDGTEWYLEPDQAETAALIAGATLRRGMPARAATIGIATGLQESKLRNIDYGDRDSLGIFQQRPSQGWGTPEQVTDPLYATNAFLDGLQQVEGYQEMEVTDAAQRVQRSAFPEAYAQHEARSRAWASALTGWSPAALTCSLPPTQQAGSATAVVERAVRDLGLQGTPEPPQEGAGEDADGFGALVVLDGTALPGVDPERGGWAVAQWAVATASALHVVRVEHVGQVWDRDSGEWAPGSAAADPGVVRVTLAG